MIYGNFPEFGNIQKGLDDKGVEVVESGFERLPLNTKELNEEEQKDLDKLLEKLEEDDDVQNVYHTIG